MSCKKLEEVLQYSAKLENTNILKTTSVTLSDNDYINSILWGGQKWDLESGEKLRYFFVDESNNYPNEIYGILRSKPVLKSWDDDNEKEQMIKGLKKWTDLVGIEIEEAQNERSSHLKFYITEEILGFLAFQVGPTGDSYQGVGLYVRYKEDDYKKYWSDTLNEGGFGFTTILHEMGHAVGLAHPHDQGGGSSIFPGVDHSGDLGDNDLNQNVFTVMSYNDIGTEFNPSSDEDLKTGFAKGPMAFDIAAMDHLYGLSENYKLDTTETSNDSQYIISDSINGYVCLYDVSGEDTILFQDNTAIVVDLRPATLKNEVGGGGFVSRLDGSNIGYTIPSGTSIENAETSEGDDIIYATDNIRHKINGGGGTDTVIYSGDYKDYIMSVSESGVIEVVKNGNSAVTDELTNIEKLQFNNITITKEQIENGENIDSNLSYNVRVVNSVEEEIKYNVVENIINIENKNLAIEDIRILLNITHTWIGDLIITLEHNGKTVTLTDQLDKGNEADGYSGIYGTNQQNLKNIEFNLDSNNVTLDSLVEYGGDPIENKNIYLEDLNEFIGETIEGKWILKIEDTFLLSDFGELISWGLEIKEREYNLFEESSGLASVEVTKEEGGDDTIYLHMMTNLYPGWKPDGGLMNEGGVYADEISTSLSENLTIDFTNREEYLDMFVDSNGEELEVELDIKNPTFGETAFVGRPNDDLPENTHWMDGNTLYPPKELLGLDMLSTEAWDVNGGDAKESYAGNLRYNIHYLAQNGEKVIRVKNDDDRIVGNDSYYAHVQPVRNVSDGGEYHLHGFRPGYEVANDGNYLYKNKVIGYTMAGVPIMGLGTEIYKNVINSDGFIESYDSTKKGSAISLYVEKQDDFPDDRPSTDPIETDYVAIGKFHSDFKLIETDDKNTNSFYLDKFNMGYVELNNVLERVYVQTIQYPYVMHTIKEQDIGLGNVNVSFDDIIIGSLELDGNNWKEISNIGEFASPVVILSPVSYNYKFPVQARTRASILQKNQKLQIGLKSPYYLERKRRYKHKNESVSYMILNEGRTISNGSIFEAGTLDKKMYNLTYTSRVLKKDVGFETITFSEAFSSEPLILCTLQEYSSNRRVKTRMIDIKVRNVTTTSFEVGLESVEQLYRLRQFNEKIGWVAIEQGVSTDYKYVTDSEELNLGGINHLFANIQDYTYEIKTTRRGRTKIIANEPVTIRVSDDKNTIYIVEDKSKDKEIIHKKEEKVGYFFSS